jgi:uncharacterized membrane protein YkoI
MSTRTRKGLIAAGVIAALGASGAAIAVATDNGGDDGLERAITGAALEQASDAALEHTGGGRVTDTETGDEESYYEVEVTRDDGGETDVQLDRNFDVVGSEDDGREDDDDLREDADDDGPDRAITGDALRRASEAALKQTGGGRVTDTEVGDDGSYYEVEVTRADGSETDVHLDRNFRVVGTDRDYESGEDDD